MATKTLPKINAIYWALVISSTTLGETAGDFISQTLGLGYGGGTIALLSFFVVAAVAEIFSKQPRRWLYWLTLTLASIGGTTLADFLARTLGLGYPTSFALVIVTVVVTLGAWKACTHSLDLKSALDARGESLYWLTILSSSTLGTVLGDLLSKDTLDLDGGALTDTAFGQFMAEHTIRLAGIGVGDAATTMILLGLLVVVTLVALKTRISRITCYWAGIIVTHPLGAALGDFMTKPDGLNLGNTLATEILLAVLAAVCVFAVLHNKKNANALTA